MTLAKLLVLLSLDSNDFNRGMYLALGQVQALQRAFLSFSNFGNGLSSLGGMLTRNLTVPLLGLLAAATVAGTGFNKEMGQIQTLLSGSFEQTTARAEKLRSVAQGMAIEFGIGTRSMAQGMYEMISAFGDGTLALTGLEKASVMARAGNVDLLETVRMLIGASKTWNDGTEAMAVTMQNLSDMAFKAAAIGQTSIPALVDSIGKVGPMAQQAGVSMEEFFSVFATVPGTIGTTSEVATMFRSVLRSLLDPTKALSKAYDELGFASGESMVKQLGFVGSLQKLLEYSGDSGESFGNLIGRVEGWTIALALAGKLNDEYNDTLKEMGDVAGTTDRAFQIVTEGIGKQAFQWEQLGVKAEVLFQKLQQGLAPALGDVLDRLGPLSDKAIELADAFTKLDSSTQQQIINWGLIAIAIGPALRVIGTVVGALTGLRGVVASVTPAIGAGLASIAGPLALLMAAVTVLAIAWNQNWFGIQERTAAAAAAIQEHMGAMKQAYNEWVETVSNTDFSSWDNFMASMANNRAAFVNMMYEIGQAIQDAIAAFFNFHNATEMGMAAVQRLQGAFQAAQSALQGFFIWIGTSASLAITTVSQSFTQLGTSIQTGLATALATARARIAELGTALSTGFQSAVNSVRSSISGLATAISSGMAAARSAAASAVTGIKAAFQINWSSIGASIASGIASGIRAGVGAITSAAVSAATAALSAAKSALGIKSPSSVMFYQVGLPIAQGVALGILSGQGLVQQAISSLYAGGLNAGGPRLAFAGAGAGGMVIQIENNFNGPVDEATIAQVEDANSRSITAALRGEGYL